MKEKVSRFRGLAGEVVRGFVYPTIWLTLISVYAFWFLFGIIMGFVGSSLPAELTLIVSYMCCFYVVGRYAMPAKNGEVHPGFFSPNLEPGDAIFFTIRHFAFSVMMIIPLGVLLHLITKNSMLSLIAGGMSGSTATFAGIVVLMLGMLLYLCIPIAALLATATDSFGDLLTKDPWLWLFKLRRDDLIPFFASLIGGGIVFFMVYIGPIALVFLVVVPKNNIQAMLLGGAMVYSAPFFAAPVLMGRLCGAFIQGGGDINEEDRKKWVESVAGGVGTPSLKSSAASTTPSTSTPTASSSTTEQSASAAATPQATTPPAGITAEVAPSQSKSTTPSEPKAAVPQPAAPEHTYEALSDDPDDALVVWSKQTLAQYPQILVASLFLRDNKLFLGVEVDNQTPLGLKQKISKELTGLAKQGIPSQHSCTVQILDEESAKKAKSVGLRVYRKKK